MSYTYFNRYGGELKVWLNPEEKHLLFKGRLSLREFCKQHGFDIKMKTYYRVKLADGKDWNEETILVRYSC